MLSGALRGAKVRAGGKDEARTIDLTRRKNVLPVKVSKGFD